MRLTADLSAKGTEQILVLLGETQRCRLVDELDDPKNLTRAVENWVCVIAMRQAASGFCALRVEQTQIHGARKERSEEARKDGRRERRCVRACVCVCVCVFDATASERRCLQGGARTTEDALCAKSSRPVHLLIEAAIFVRVSNIDELLCGEASADEPLVPRHDDLVAGEPISHSGDQYLALTIDQKPARERMARAWRAIVKWHCIPSHKRREGIRVKAAEEGTGVWPRQLLSSQGGEQPISHCRSLDFHERLGMDHRLGEEHLGAAR